MLDASPLLPFPNRPTNDEPFHGIYKLLQSHCKVNSKRQCNKIKQQMPMSKGKLINRYIPVKFQRAVAIADASIRFVQFQIGLAPLRIEKGIRRIKNDGLLICLHRIVITLLRVMGGSLGT